MLNEIHQRLISKFVHAQINGEITLSNALEILKDEFIKEETYNNKEELYDAFMKIYDVPPLYTKTRKREVVAVRQYYFYIAKKIFKNRYSLKILGEYIGQKKPFDHTTVIHSIQNVKNNIDTKDELMTSIIEKFTKYTNEKFGK